MSFDSLESSVQDSQPRELWTFVTPAATYRYTTAEVPVVFSGDTYTPIAAGRDDFKGATITDAAEMVLELPRTNGFVQDNAFGMPPQNMTVQILRLQGAFYESWWLGAVSAFTVERDRCKVRSPSILADALDMTIPSARVGPQCNRMLYSPGCDVDRDDPANKTTTTVVSSNGVFVLVASVGGHVDDYFKPGVFIHDADGERRLIIKQTGAQLELNARLRSISGGDAITLLRGCKHTIDACDGFSNIPNFGGHPYVPKSNPFKGSLVGGSFS